MGHHGKQWNSGMCYTLWSIPSPESYKTMYEKNAGHAVNKWGLFNASLNLQLPIMRGQCCVSRGYLCRSIGHVDFIVNLHQHDDATRYVVLTVMWTVRVNKDYSHKKCYFTHAWRLQHPFPSLYTPGQWLHFVCLCYTTRCFSSFLILQLTAAS